MAWLFVKVVYYPAYYTYHGEYGGTIVQFKTPPDQIPFMDKLGEWLADRVPKEAAKKGVTPLKLRVLKDTDPTWWTTWQVEFRGHGSLTLAVLLSLLPLIIKGAIALLLAFFAWQVIKSFSGLWQATPQEIELEEKKLEVTEELIEQGYSPEEIADIIAGIKAAPQGIELPEWVAPAAIGGGVLLLGVVALAATRRD